MPSNAFWSVVWSKGSASTTTGCCPKLLNPTKVIYTRLDFSFISVESSTNGIGSGDWGSRSTIEGSKKRSRALSATSESGKTMKNHIVTSVNLTIRSWHNDNLAFSKAS